MTRFFPINVLVLALMLAGVGFAQNSAPNQTEDKAAAAQATAPAEKATSEQKTAEPSAQGDSTNTPAKSTDASKDQEATTPVTPQAKKAAATDEGAFTKRPLSEAEALPQGTPFVPDLNLFGPSTAELRQKLTNALRNDPALNGSSVVATVTDDSISLTGSVRTAKDRITARRIAESFATNRKVTEKISVAGSAATNGINQSPAASSGVNPPKTQSSPPPTSTGQKPESPNRTMDPVNTQEKPRSGSEY
jgi:hypothetical protein